MPTRGTRPTRTSSGHPTRSAPFRVRPLPTIVAAIVLAAFAIGLLLGGAVGGVIIAALALAAGTLLVLRWQAIDPRIRLFRLGAVLLTLAIAVTVIVRR